MGGSASKYKVADFFILLPDEPTSTKSDDGGIFLVASGSRYSIQIKVTDCDSESDARSWVSKWATLFPDGDWKGLTSEPHSRGSFSGRLATGRSGGTQGTLIILSDRTGRLYVLSLLAHSADRLAQLILDSFQPVHSQDLSPKAGAAKANASAPSRPASGSQGSSPPAVLQPDYKAWAQACFSAYERDKALGILVARVEVHMVTRESLAYLHETLQGKTMQLGAAEKERSRMSVYTGLTIPFAGQPQQLQIANLENFIAILNLLASHGGDPPASPGLIAIAEDILQDRMAPSDAVKVIASEKPHVGLEGLFIRGLNWMTSTGLSGLADFFLREQILVYAALGIPRQEILPVLRQVWKLDV